MGEILRTPIPYTSLPIIVPLVLVTIWLLLRNRATELASGVDGVVGKGRPVILEFFSNTWMQCLVAKPIVDGIERELAGRARVVRMNVINKEGREAAQRYGVRGLPTTVVLDGDGEVIDVHAGIPSKKKIVAQATAA